MEQAPVISKVGVCPMNTREVANKIIIFAELLNAMEFYSYQRVFVYRMVESVLMNDGATITGLWARQCGKTESISAIVIAMAVLLPILSKAFPNDPRFMLFAKGFLVGIYAPVKEQAGLSFDRMRGRLESEHGQSVLSDPEIDVRIVVSRGDTIGLSNGSVILARTASENSMIEGKTHHLVVCEESQKLSRQKVIKEILPMLSSTFGSIVHIGTAWSSRGGFHHSIQQNEDDRKKGGPRNHFEVPYDIVIKEKEEVYRRTKDTSHLAYVKAIQSEIKKNGIDSDEFKMNYRCLWQEARVIAIRKEILIAGGRNNLIAYPVKTKMQVAGLDVGKVIDFTVLSIMDVDMDNPVQNTSYLAGADTDLQVSYPKTFLDWYELGGSFEGDAGQYIRLINILKMYSVQVLVIDATGIGDPVAERIAAICGDSIQVVPFKFSNMSKGHLYKYYLGEWTAGRIGYPAHPETRDRVEYRKFFQEHEDLDKVQIGEYAVCKAPDGLHDDYPSSGALACWAEKLLSKLIMPPITVTDFDDFTSGYRGKSDEGPRGRADRYRQGWMK